MATVQRKLVHKQFNSPIGLYSDNNVKSTLNRELKVLSNGTMGVECDDSSKPANLANSAVLKLLEEEEQAKRYGYQPGLKRVAWPPEHEYPSRASQPRQSPAIQPQNYHRNPLSPPTQYHNGNVGNQPAYPQSHYQQQHSQPHAQPPYQQHHSQPQYAPQSHQQPVYQRQPSQQSQYPSSQAFPNPDPTFLRQSTPSYLPSPSQQGRGTSPSCTAAFAGGISVNANKQPPVSRPLFSPVQNRAYNESIPVPVHPHSSSSHPQHVPSVPLTPDSGSSLRGWSRVKPAEPVYTGYTQPQYNQQPYQNQQSSYTKPHDENRFQQQDYTNFFEQHAVNKNYPGYRAPPGTQHYSPYTSH